MRISAEGLLSSGRRARRPDGRDLNVQGHGGRSHLIPPISQANCGAVVTAFRPPRELLSNVQALLHRFRAVTIVDDGSGDPDGVIHACRLLGAEVVSLETNSGIGAALNAGVVALRSSHPDVSYVVTFDQDSLPPDSMLELFEAARIAAAAVDLRIGAICPEQVSGSRVLVDSRRAGFAEVREPIQSGLLVPVTVFDDVGGFDEDLFIDGVDTDFYWKLRRAGYVAVSAPGVSLEHSLGTRQQARILGRPVITPSGPLMVMQSAPFRYYYLGRNRIHLLRRYSWSERTWMLRGLMLDLRHVAVVTLFGSERRRRLGYFLRGVGDGMLGRTGKIRSAR